MKRNRARSVFARVSPTWLVERLKCIATAYAVSMNSSGMLTRSSTAWSFSPKRWRSIALPLIACKEGREDESLSSRQVSKTARFLGLEKRIFLKISKLEGN